MGKTKKVSTVSRQATTSKRHYGTVTVALPFAHSYVDDAEVEYARSNASVTDHFSLYEEQLFEIRKALYRTPQGFCQTVRLHFERNSIKVLNVHGSDVIHISHIVCLLSKHICHLSQAGGNQSITIVSFKYQTYENYI